jgi:hypothetical protein
MHNERIQEMARLIDDALCSEDPRVRRAFSRLMTTVALIEDESREYPGPFQSLIEHIDTLTMRVRELEIKEQQKEMVFSKYSQGGTDWN